MAPQLIEATIVYLQMLAGRRQVRLYNFDLLMVVVGAWDWVWANAWIKG